MAGSGRASRGLLLALFAAGVAHQACTPDKGQGDEPVAGEPLTEALAAVGPQVVLPALADFLVQVDALEGALGGWAGEPSSETARADAQARWDDAMLSWQRLELMQIGPAGSSLTAVGGEDLRDEIYSWPTINPCRIDQETVYQEWDDPAWFTENLVNSYGMDALEHLVYGGEDNTCSGQVDINEDGSWDALGPDGVAASRAAFALALVAEIRGLAESLEQIWLPEGGDLSGGMIGGEGSLYESQQQALNAVFDALFYLETVTKDRKLAQPLGLGDDCGADTCPGDVELLESGLSTAAIQVNLEAFRALLTGAGTWGLDDILEDIGHGDLAAQLLADLDAADAAVAALDAPVDQLLEQDPQAVAALNDALKAVTDALKGDLATVLVLEIPAEAAGDND